MCFLFAVLDFFHIQSISFSTSSFLGLLSSRNSNITQVQNQPVLHLWNQPWMNHQFWKALSAMKHLKHGLYAKSALPGRPSSPPPRYFRAPDSIDWWESPWADKKKQPRIPREIPSNSDAFCCEASEFPYKIHQLLLIVSLCTYIYVYLFIYIYIYLRISIMVSY